MSRRFLLFATFLLAAPASAQVEGLSAERLADLVPVAGPIRNIVENLEAQGDTLWAGQRLIFTTDGGATFNFVDTSAVFTPAIAPNAIVYSLDVEGDVIWVGLGFNDNSIASRPQSAAGFAYSEDGGDTWTYRFPPLDAPQDSLQTYGCNYFPPDVTEDEIVPIAGCNVLSTQLFTLPIIVPQLSPPFDIDYDPVTRDVWTAGLLSGVRKLEWLPDSGRYAAEFARVVLPPDTLGAISPQVPYGFPLIPELPGLSDEGTNFIAYSVLVDETGTVWAGTEAGINRSRPEDVFAFTVADSTFEERAWTRTGFDGTASGLLSSAVISIEEQPLGDAAFPVGSPENPRNPVWATNWRPLATEAKPGEEFGVVVTRDGGETFAAVLIGTGRIFDFGFCGGAPFCTAQTVYAAGADGLYVSDDDGATWRTIRDFRDAERPGRFVKRDAPVYAVATTRDALWVGTGDGLLKSTDGGTTWTIFRTDVPTNPETPTDRTPSVDVYAYPNPFSPNADTVIRIRHDQPSASIRIFDFAMTLVRSIPDAAPVEQVWDGYDENGNRVANGVYFYEVDTPAGSFWGKILVLE